MNALPRAICANRIAVANDSTNVTPQQAVGHVLPASSHHGRFGCTKQNVLFSEKRAPINPGGDGW